MARPPVKRLAALLVILLVSTGLLVLTRHRRSLRTQAPLLSVQTVEQQLLARFSALESRERQIDETTWAGERRAEERGALFDSLWDEVNKATNKLESIGAFGVNEIVLGKFAPAQRLEHQIELYEPQGKQSPLSGRQWQEFLREQSRAGWEVAHLEFRQRSFDIETNGGLKQSRFYFRADVANEAQNRRATLEGDLLVDWLPQANPGEPIIERIDAGRLKIRARTGPPWFSAIQVETIQPLEKWLFIDPLILYDLDGDGLSEILLPGKNLVYRRTGESYQAQPLCAHPPGRILTAVVADFTGDGFADLICAKAEGLVLFKGSSAGKFEEPGQVVWEANPPLKYGQVLTCGDIDHDGDLDLFLGQYKSPYNHGQMPTPYYDANDGEPAYLLLNDGQGKFTDATQSSGLAKKRWRRSYSGSFIDLDGDGNLDLVVVSDFAGLDLYKNNAHGHFTDVTHDWVKDSMGFGMGHTLADFNSDGRLDLLMIGMGSPTVERLEHQRLWRSDSTEDRSMRSRLTFGNRLLLQRADGGFEQTRLNDDIAQTGWSWGGSACDLDNDSFPDLYIANGHESRPSVRDYEPEFWLHDIYVGDSKDDPVANTYFQAKFSQTRGRGQSYGGYDKNRLYLNRGGESFFEAGYLMGVALEQDCRNVVADDLDGDGRVDLLVTTFEVWPEIKQTLRVFKNTTTDSGNWIGFRLREEGGGRSPVGARITVRRCGQTAVAVIVTGDSYRSQSANTVHFGLGTCTQVEQAEILWVDGARLVLTNLAANRYYSVSAREKAPSH